MNICSIDDKSPFLASVIKLGDENAKTLGFLPEQAYYDHARKNHIIVAISEQHDFIGYLLYRISRDITSIVHLCVSDAYRGTGAAKALMDYLFEETKHTYEIRLSCRRDYDVDGFWQSLGFTALSERPGRSKSTQTILTVWHRCHEHDTLFDYAERALISKTFIAVLDTNVVIDLCEKADEESKHLDAPYLQDIVTFKVANTIFREINTQTDDDLRNKTRNFAKRYDIVNYEDLADYKHIARDIESKLQTTVSVNTRQDIYHITHAVIAGALAFVTRDQDWLGSEVAHYINTRYGLQILSPGEFILSIDELSHQEDYTPQRLIGLDIKYSKISTAELNKISCDFQNTTANESLSQLKQCVRNLVADSQNSEVFVVKKGNTTIALIGFSAKNDGIELVLFRLSAKAISPSLRPTLLKRMAMWLLENAVKANAKWISLKYALGVSEEIVEAFLEAGYLKSESQIYKILLDGQFDRNQFVEKYALICQKNGFEDLVGCANISVDKPLLPQDVVYIEKSFWPMKLSDISLPTYIVPIKPSYAMELFDEDLSNSNISLVPNERTEPALSIENIYFKSPNLTPREFPARILWYVSNGKNIMYDMAIRACSYLDLVDSGAAKTLFERYKRLGVLDWKKILTLAKGNPNGSISCYRFSYTELFAHPIKYTELKKWYRTRYNKAVSLQSYTEIDNSAFLELYRFGKHGTFTAPTTTYFGR